MGRNRSDADGAEMAGIKIARCRIMEAGGLVPVAALEIAGHGRLRPSLILRRTWRDEPLSARQSRLPHGMNPAASWQEPLLLASDESDAGTSTLGSRRTLGCSWR